MEFENIKLINLISNLIKTEAEFEDIKNYIINNFKEIPYMNYAQFIKDMSLSQEYADKFLAENGFNSFSELKMKVTEIIFDMIHNNDDLFVDKSFNKESIKNILSLNIEVEENNMRSMLSSIDQDKLCELISDIINSPEVIIIGTRASTTLAHYSSYMLNKIGINVKKITSAGTSSFDNIQNFDRSSLVIAFGFPRYPMETIKILNYFTRKNFKIISITDNEKSPLCNFSSYSLFVKAYSIGYTDSFINGLVLINTIALAIGKIDNKKVIKRLNDFEETAKSLEYYF
jgi:DNA-binding MurR/RpiR family transcriptional regulator